MIMGERVYNVWFIFHGKSYEQIFHIEHLGRFFLKVTYSQKEELNERAYLGGGFKYFSCSPLLGK